MGYFANGTEGELYEEEYCVRCCHHPGCPIIDAHMAYNYDEANNNASILHLLIPRDPETGHNMQCRLFLPRLKVHEEKPEMDFSMLEAVDEPLER